MTFPNALESKKPAPSPAAGRRPAPRAAVSGKSRRSPNYAGREETLKIAEEIMDERAELFRRLADA